MGAAGTLRLGCPTWMTSNLLCRNSARTDSSCWALSLGLKKSIILLYLSLMVTQFLLLPLLIVTSFSFFRPPDIVCRRTYILPVFLLSFFFRRLISEVAERNSTKIGHVVGSKCNLKTHVRHLGYPRPLQIGGPKTTFLGRLRNLTATLAAYIFGTKHDIDNRSSALTTTMGLLHRPKMS